jgi:asparagine synthase (glutamine-hydrolysing)
MFAFAIYDKRPQHLVGDRPTLLVARDRFGIKPLYYHVAADGGIAFASEVKALRRSGLFAGSLDPEGITGFLLLGSVPSPLTITKEVRCLAPGEYLAVGASGIRKAHYWDFSDTPTDLSGSSSVTDIRRALRESVERHLISDAPVGVFLSGGVDSAAIVAMASESHPDLTTLTVAVDDKHYNEADEAKAVAKRFGTKHIEIHLTSNDFRDAIPEMLGAMDQPTNDGLNTLVISKAAKQANLKVLLSGLGGDEVFAGYRYYKLLQRYKTSISGFAAAPPFARNFVLGAAAAFGEFRGDEKWMRLSVLQNKVSNESLYVALRGFYAPQQIAKLLDLTSSEMRDALDRQLSTIRPPLANGVLSGRMFNLIEMRRYMHDQLLRDTDVFSMSQSIEVRVPLLDPALVDLARRIPQEDLLSPSLNKPALVNAVDNAAVTEASQRTKRGFSFPFADWMKDHSSELRQRANSSAILKRPEVDRLWNEFEQNRLHWSRAWALVVLGEGANA